MEETKEENKEDNLVKSKNRMILPYLGKEKQIRYHIEHSFSVKDEEFLRCMGHLLGPCILKGNKVKTLKNGNEIFPAMLQEIKNAKKTITFETFIYSKGHIGEKFSEAFCERARAGVKVHVIMDWAGSEDIDNKYILDMTKAGVEVEKYHPPRWYNFYKINNRTHRKLLIIDGKVGFIGGVGIDDKWDGNAQSKEHWRDSHYKVEGPVVAEMQAVFDNNWLKTHSKLLLGKDYFPELKPLAGGILAQAFKSSSNGSQNARLMNLLSIASAGKSVRLQAAYFMPDKFAVETLLAARKRGVDIEIIVPGPYMDEKLLKKSSQSIWGILLDAGVKIYEYQPTMYHCKTIIVDDLWVSVGSTNFDSRSFLLNDEANLNIYDANFAKEQIKVFEEDKKKSILVTRENFKERSSIGKIFNVLASLVRGQI